MTGYQYGTAATVPVTLAQGSLLGVAVTSCHSSTGSSSRMMLMRHCGDEFERLEGRRRNACYFYRIFSAFNNDCTLFVMLVYKLSLFTLRDLQQLDATCIEDHHYHHRRRRRRRHRRHQSV